MKLVKILMLFSLLTVLPSASLAGTFDDDLPPIGDFDDTAPAVPEPSGALLMGVALATVALVVGRQRK